MANVTPTQYGFLVRFRCFITGRPSSCRTMIVSAYSESEAREAAEARASEPGYCPEMNTVGEVHYEGPVAA